MKYLMYCKQCRRVVFIAKVPFIQALDNPKVVTQLLVMSCYEIIYNFYLSDNSVKTNF